MTEPQRDLQQDSNSAGLVEAGQSSVTRVRALGRFSRRVLRRFSQNRGLLLAGGVAYNALLSLIPLLALVVVVQSYFFDQDRVIHVVQSQLRLLTGEAQAVALTSAFVGFMNNRGLIGALGFAMLIFFSSLAFSMLQGAFEQIFYLSPNQRPRSRLAAQVMPYVLTGVFWASLLALTGLLGALRLSTDVPYGESALYVLGLFNESLLFAALYWVVPSQRVSFRRAALGGFVAMVLWEATRSIFVWYVASLSLVSVIYGSFATVIIVLLSLEFATIILLVGAQVIAELQHSEAHGLPWHEEPDEAV